MVRHFHGPEVARHALSIADPTVEKWGEKSGQVNLKTRPKMGISTLLKICHFPWEVYQILSPNSNH